MNQVVNLIRKACSPIILTFMEIVICENELQSEKAFFLIDVTVAESEI